MPATELLIGIDPLGHAVTIHQAKTPEGIYFYNSNTHFGDGSSSWGYMTEWFNNFRDVRRFPSFHYLWPDPDLNYGQHHKRQRIYSIAVHFAVTLP